MAMETFEDHARELTSLLADAEASAQSGDRPRMKRARAALLGFITQSNDLVDGVSELDQVARDAFRDLVLSAIEEIVAGLAERTADVAALTKRFATQGAANTSAAAAIRLEHAREVASAAITLVGELRALRARLDGGVPGSDELVALIERALEAIGAVQIRIGERLGAAPEPPTRAGAGRTARRRRKHPPR